MKRNVTLIHTSPAAIRPVNDHYHAHAPDLELTNLLDEGLLHCFAEGELSQVEFRLSEMIRTACLNQETDMVLLTCSSVPLEMLESLRSAFGFPVLRIDEPMLRQAVLSGDKIGVLATFEPSIKTTSEMLLSQAEAAGKRIELQTEVASGAYESLLAGNRSEHDHQLLEAARRLEAASVDLIVLAQVSMACSLEWLKARLRTPLVESLDTSLQSLRMTLGYRTE